MAKKTQTKKTTTVQIGNKVLRLENADEMDSDFLERFNAVVASSPKTIQEFIERLAEEPIAQKKIVRRRKKPDNSTKGNKIR